jgi:short-subunit dehydrogenase
MKQRFINKRVVIIGASGGLGEAYAQAFQDEGASLLLVSRNPEKGQALGEQLGVETAVAAADITDETSVRKLAEVVDEWCGSGGVDVVVNATGFDVRKPLTRHEPEEIRRTLDTNLLGAILITRQFLALMKNSSGSTIVHMGGFADGRLAFPYYSVDVASRAGIHAFAEAMNRELKQEDSQVTVTYFCPNSADTPAERPFHEVWKEMGITISSPEQVAAELLDAVARKRTVWLMGGLPTRAFAKLNVLAPRLADKLLLNRYGRILQKHFGGGETLLSTRTARKKTLRVAAIVMIALSFILYALLPVLPFLPLTVTTKSVAGGVLIGVSEIIFWIGAVILGKEAVAKYKRWLNPLHWFCCGKRPEV